MTIKSLLIPISELPDLSFRETEADPFPNRLPCGTPVAITMNAPVLPDDDPADEFTTTGALIEYIDWDGDGPTENILGYYLDPRIRRGVYYDSTVCLDLNTDGGLYAAIQQIVKALGENPVPTGHDFYRVETGGYWMDMGENHIGAMSFVYFSPHALTPKEDVGWPTVVVPALADIDPTDPLRDRHALIAILRVAGRGRYYVYYPKIGAVSNG